MNWQRELRDYLIRKFVITLVVVTLVESIINLAFDQWLFPFLENFTQQYSFSEGISTFEIIIFLIVLISKVILTLISGLVPSPIDNAILSASEAIGDYAVKTFPRLGQGILASEIGTIQLTQIAATLVGLLIIYLVPYAVGVLAIVKATMKKFDELEKEQEKARAEFDKRRNLMLSDIAHDLRTPMTTISGYAKALNDGMVTDEEKQREYLDTIQVKSKRMNDLVELLFEYVKLDSDGFSLEREDCDIAELLRENAAVMYTDIEEAGMEFDIDIPEEAIYLSLDKIQFSRVITNLLVNAIRHNKPGAKIGLSLRKMPGVLLVDVADSGEAIPDDVAKTIFEPFAKADKSRSNRGGSGLGLSIAKKIVNMHGFDILLNNKYVGYTKSFEIRIPISHL